MDRSPVDRINQILEERAPALHAALSPLGRRAFYPQDIPEQAREARGAEYNGTIGIFTDGRGGAVPLPSMDAALELESEDRDRAFLYSPILGLPELRRLWRDRQRRGQPDGVPSTLPVVTVGLTHGLSLVADLCGGEGRVVAVPVPFWGNYRSTFALRTGAEIRTAPAYRGGRFHPGAWAEALAGLDAGRPAVALLNFPSNPGGYAPEDRERRELCRSLLEIAEERPLVALCDDAYDGFVYAPDVPRASLFWDLAGRHPNLVPVKIDGATKEFSFFGGRVGFLTFGLDLDDETTAALENKLQSLLRSTIGSPVATSQAILLQALRRGETDREIAELHAVAERRFHALQEALAGIDRELLRPLPANAGFFALLEIPEELGVSAQEARRHLLDRHSTGVVSIAPRYLRIALCSVAADDLGELVRRVERGVRELAGRG